jgi:hypothetical protein
MPVTAKTAVLTARPAHGRGFGSEWPAETGRGSVSRALLTALLVLYPALASVAVVVAAFMLRGGMFT